MIAKVYALALFIDGKSVAAEETAVEQKRRHGAQRRGQYAERQAEAEKPLEIDVLILSQDRTFSIEQLTRVFYPKQIVFDSSLPQYIRNRLMDECAGLGIPAHDVSQDGAFFINL